MTSIGIIGSEGRMGVALAAAISEAGQRSCGIDKGGNVVRLASDADVLVDFSSPAALETTLDACVAARTPIVIGTTGLEERQQKAMEKAAHEIPIVYARNMSVGVNVFTELVARAAKALGDGYDVEIAETHHRHKVDAPSGTALALGERIAATRGRKLNELAVYARHGTTGPRVPGTIGFSVGRGGNVVGEHSVRFIGPEEEVEFFHGASDRKTFARGALRAARWAAGRAPGLYSMADVLGLSRD